MASPVTRLLRTSRLTWLAVVALLLVADALPAASPALPRKASSRSADALPDGAIARFGGLRFRHPAALTAAALSPDGKMFASAGPDTIVRLWNAETGRELRQIETPGRIPAALAFSPDSKVVAAGSYEMLRLWDVTTGKELPGFRANETSAYALAFSPDGKILAAAGGDDLVVRVWDASGKERHRLAGHKGWAGSVAFSPDGKLLATAGGDLRDRDGIIRLWDPDTGKSAGQLKGHEHAVTAIAFSADGKQLASSSRDNTLRLWDVAARKESRAARLARGARSLVFAADGKTLVSGEDTTVRLWELAALRERRRFDWRMVNDSDSAVAVSFFPDGQRLATAHQGGLLRVWDVAAGKERAPHQGHQGEVRALTVSPDGKWLATAEDSPVVRLWDRAAGKEVRQCVLPSGTAFCVAFSTDNRRVAAGSSTGLALCWDVATGEETHTFSSADRGVAALRFAPDGKVLAAALADGTCLLWPLAGGAGKVLGRNRFGRMVPPLAAPHTLDFSPDGKLLAHGSYAEAAYLFTVASGIERPERGKGGGLPLLTETNRSTRTALNAAALVAFSPDGRSLATRSEHQVLLWEVGPGALPLPPPSEQERGDRRETYLRRAVRRKLTDGQLVVAFAYSPDGRTFAIGRDDGRVGVWDLFTGKELHQFAAHPRRVNALAFLPDGRGLVSAGDDAALMIWDVGSLLRDKMPKPPELAKADLPGLWADLAKVESAPGFEALCRLIQAPDAALPYLKEQLSLPAPDPKEIKKLIADLDSNQFKVRQRAAEKLEMYGAHAEAALEEALAAKPALEVARRLEELLRKRAATCDGDALRDQRAVEVLERIDTPAARRLLQTLADGPADRLRTMSAKAALRRMSAK